MINIISFNIYPSVFCERSGSLKVPGRFWIWKLTWNIFSYNENLYMSSWRKFGLKIYGQHLIRWYTYWQKNMYSTNDRTLFQSCREFLRATWSQSKQKKTNETNTRKLKQRKKSNRNNKWDNRKIKWE